MSKGRKPLDPVFKGGAIVTVIWLFIVAFYLANPATDSDGQEARWHQLWGADINLVGDFLAGAFAPLAFFWLVLAVIIQSKELSTQQQELRETRNLHEAHRREAEKTAEFIGTQTSLLVEQSEERQQQQAFLEFRAQIRSLGLMHPKWKIGRIAPTENWGDEFQVFPPVDDRDPMELVDHLIKSIENAYASMVPTDGRYNCVDEIDAMVWHLLLGQLRTIDAISPRLSTVDLITAQDHRVEEAIVLLEVLLTGKSDYVSPSPTGGC